MSSAVASYNRLPFLLNTVPHTGGDSDALQGQFVWNMPWIQAILRSCPLASQFVLTVSYGFSKFHSFKIDGVDVVIGLIARRSR
jgi:hypothetical protein